MSSEKHCYFWVHLPAPTDQAEVTWMYRKRGESTWKPLASCDRKKDGWWRSSTWLFVGDPTWELSCWAGGIAVVASMPSPSLSELGSVLAETEVPALDAVPPIALGVVGISVALLNPSSFELGPWLAQGEVPVKPALLAELQQNTSLREAVPQVDWVIEDIQRKLAHLASLGEQGLGMAFEPNALGAVLAYTHDLMPVSGGEEGGNLFYECSQAIKERSETLRETWGVYLDWFFKGLDALPTSLEGEGFCCLPELPEEYSEGSVVQWDRFATIVTGDAAFDLAKEQTDEDKGVILKLAIKSAKVLGPVAFFYSPEGPGEVAVYPMSKFKVATEPYKMEGYTCVDLEQQAEDASSIDAWGRLFA